MLRPALFIRVFLSYHPPMRLLLIFLLSLPVLAEKPRPKTWAQPLKLDGVPNLHKVDEQTLPLRPAHRRRHEKPP